MGRHPHFVHPAPDYVSGTNRRPATRHSATRTMTAAVTQVFVYGSLLSGLHNHRLLDDAVFIRAASTGPGFRLFDLGPHPGAVLAGGAQPSDSGSGYAIHGEVYDVSEAILARLDALEEHPNYYRREVIELPSGASAWIYLLPQAPSGVPEVTSGDWRTYLARRPRHSGD